MDRLCKKFIDILNEQDFCFTPEEMKIVKMSLARFQAYEDAEDQGLLVRLPCKLDDTVYRICPKCNDKHNGSCKHCAWEGTAGWNGCTMFGIWSDGQYPAERCQVIPWKVTWERMPTILKQIGKRIFPTREEAEAMLAKEK